MTTKPTKKLTVSDLTPDRKNRRSRTERGAKMLAESLDQLGAARSIVIDENNEVLAGNGVLDAAIEVGITNLQIVDADGKTLVAVRRSGLSPDEKRALALYDNRTGELAEWEPEQIARDQQNGDSLVPWFTEMELRKILKVSGGGKAPTVRELDTGAIADRFWIAVRGPLKDQATTLQRLREILQANPALDIELGLQQETEAWTG
jgi:hypothetical protein